MQGRYDPKTIEGKWQAKWEEQGAFSAHDDSEKPKYYCLIEFPYPSGQGLHIGHIRSNTAMDIVARKRRMEGYDVLYPMGWDAFGLPTENYAIKTGIHPREVTCQNTDNFRRQLKSIGFSFDWSREINTTDPGYFKWTQWIFLQMLKKGLAYKAKMMINWCPSCKIGLANEEVIDGKCERCGSETEKREKEQWMLAITKYADRLHDDLDTVDYLEKIKIQQRNWIGRSEGTTVDFRIIPERRPKVIIIHGFEGNPDIGWKPWLKRTLEGFGYEVLSPELPNAAHPDFDETMDFLERQTDDFGPDDVVIGHSLGGHFALKLCERKKIGKAVLVAPTIGGFPMPYDDWQKNDPESDFESCRRVLEGHPVDFSVVQASEKRAVFGESDRGIPITHADLLDDSWEVTRIPNVGHMSNEVSVSEILDAVVPAVSVFTTRVDTLFGCSYVVVAPEHPLIGEQLTVNSEQGTGLKNRVEVEKYIEETRKKSEMDRTAEGREKTGVRLEGLMAVNPINGEEVPVFVADYVLGDYGTGAVMAVPAHDERDFAFAKKYDLPVRNVIMPHLIDKKNPPREGKKSVERNTIHALVRNPKDGKFLCLEWKQHPWTTFIVGGVEDGEDIVEAAKREVLEETGFSNLKYVKTLGGKVRGEYFAAHKDENRVANTSSLLFELVDETREQVAEDEAAKHSTIWLSLDEIRSREMACAELDFWLERLEGNEDAFVDDGALTDSGEFSGLSSAEAREKISEKLEADGNGKRVVKYKLRDWVFSRQRYWGEQIPVVHCEKCGIVALPESELPLELPEIDGGYSPTDTGESPLAKIESWVNTTCPTCGGPARRETDTMPNWAGSSWYFLRYADPKNGSALADLEKLKRYMPVDWYNGGMEHTTLHLLYSRFWNKFLYDIGVAPTSEPYQKRTSHGLILAEGGVKMSKSKGNVINPDDIVSDFGADTLRIYEMFMGPFDQHIAWGQNGLVGSRRFLERVWKLSAKVKGGAEDSRALLFALHGSVKKVSEDIEAMRFNTAVSSMMILVNAMEKESSISNDSFGRFLRILSPFAPHIAEELWEGIGNADSVSRAAWPEAEPAYLVLDTVKIVVQVNGKMRDSFEISAEASEDDLKARALGSDKVKPYLDGKEPKRVIVVPGKLVNVVV
jgi:leucyl-tRNA synthetase